MTRFAFINQDINRLKEEIRLGIVKPCVLRHYEIYCRYDYYRKQGHNIMDASLFTSIDHGVSDNWVFRIIKMMEKDR